MTQPLGASFANAGKGVAIAFRQRNMRIHLCFAVAAVVLGLVLRIPVSSWLAVILCIGIVFALEILNTALESAVDLASPEYHELAGRAKDCAAGAVLVMAVVSLVVACVVYIPPFLVLIGA